jgi:hypothetical protein
MKYMISMTSSAASYLYRPFHQCMSSVTIHPYHVTNSNSTNDDGCKAHIPLLKSLVKKRIDKATASHTQSDTVAGRAE